MSLVYNKDFNFNGRSQVAGTKAGDEPITVVTMNATFQNDGRLYISKNVEDVATYIANKEMVDADYAEFEGKVLKSIEDATVA